MTSADNRSDKNASRPRPTRAQRITAAGFLGAFGLTIITVLLTGLWVRAPRTRAGAGPPPAASAEPTPAAVAEPNPIVHEPAAALAPRPQPEATAERAAPDDADDRPDADVVGERVTPQGR